MKKKRHGPGYWKKQHEKKTWLCPNCDGDNIEGGGIDVEGVLAYQECSCDDCGAEWMDFFILSSTIITR
jgi:hypothetical protein